MCNFFCLLISVLTLAVGKILLNNNIDKIETEETYAESDFYFQVVTKSYKAGSSKTTKSEGSESGQTSQSDDVHGCFDVGWYEDENDNKKNFDATLGYSGGSHDGGSSSVTATYNSAMPAITTPSRTGYSFQGYYTGTNGSGTKYYDNNGKSARNWDKTSNTTLYAYWTANGYTLTANANGGSGSMSNQSMTYDKASNLTTNTYTRQGLIIGNVATNAKVTVSDCFGNSSASANFYNGTATVSNSLYNVGGTKKYYDGNFANWVVLNGQPLPSGLTWIGIGGDKVTNISQITACGYSKV